MPDFQSERLITLCATDATFTTLPASMVASASLASAVQQDYESGHPPTAGPSVRIKEIFNKIREFTRVEMVRQSPYSLRSLGGWILSLIVQLQNDRYSWKRALIA